MSSPPNATNVNPKDCVYGCNTKIYWNTIISEYWEISTNKKHVCPNRSSNNHKPVPAAATIAATPTNNNATPKPTHYNNNNKNSYNSNYNYKKPWNPKLNNKQPMDNSLEILQGSSTDVIRSQYEVLADLIKEYNGKTHGSQSHILANGSMQLIVYFEVPEGTREELKRKFRDFARNEVKVYPPNQQ